MPRQTVFISGGGTGGHLYPALVLGRRLKEADPSLEIVFIGSRRAAEQRILAAQGVRSVALAVEGLKGRGLKTLRGLGLLPGAFLKSLLLLLRLKPGLTVGVGGFSSGPVLWLASRLRIPTLILEQNVKPGFTNRRLLPRVQRAVVAFEESLPYFRGKGVWLGNPVRPEFASLPPRPPDARLRLLIFGGSQGSRVLNQAVLSALPLLAEVRGRLSLVHQTGPAERDRIRAGYDEAGFAGTEVEAFFEDLPARMGRADLILSRAGATTCAELIAAGRAAVLVPFAGASENHQAFNAEALRKAGGAEVLPESELTPLRLAERIRFYVSHRESLASMEKGLAALRTPDAAAKIAALALEMLRGGRQE